MELRQRWGAAKIRKFQHGLLRWYGKHRRRLPWRDNPTPYRVWISEIMLQQTQVKTVLPYYRRFLGRFPSITSLAEAEEHEVLALWSGLGYYSRARNLHKAARLIIEKHGDFPERYEDILNLPGIGRYTAGAISSIAFNQAQPVVDGNIQRAIIRLKGILKRPPASFFWNQMSALLPIAKPSSFNQAMMELGAVICTPSQPHCPECPVESFCEARKLGIQNRIPSVRRKQPARRIQIAILILEHKGKVLLTSVHKPDFIPGKWGFPCQQILEGESPEDAARRLSRIILGRKISLLQSLKMRHSITCYRITCYGFLSRSGCFRKVPYRAGTFRWANYRQCGLLLTSSLFRKVVEKIPGMSPALKR